jgi:hypothetical protein
MVTVAPGITAPEGSFTVPETDTELASALKKLAPPSKNKNRLVIANL